MMTDVAPAELMSGGRVVARFRTDPAEVITVGSTFTPPLHLAIPGGKTGLFGVGLLFGMGMAVWGDYLPAWPAWLSWFLAGLVIGLLFSVMLWILLGKRSQRRMAVMGRAGDMQAVTVACHAGGLSWATTEVVHYVAYDSIDQITEQNGMILIRYKLFILYVPPRGFGSPGDRSFMIDTLRRVVPAERLSGVGAGQG